MGQYMPSRKFSHGRIPWWVILMANRGHWPAAYRKRGAAQTWRSAYHARRMMATFRLNPSAIEDEIERRGAS